MKRKTFFMSLTAFCMSCIFCVGYGQSVGNFTQLTVKNTSATQTTTTYTNTNTGTATTNGFVTGIEAAGNGLVWHRNNTYIRFGTNAAERMRILANGRIGIGRTNPDEMLHVNGNIKADTVKANSILLPENLGIGITTPVAKLHAHYKWALGTTAGNYYRVAWFNRINRCSRSNDL